MANFFDKFDEQVSTRPQEENFFNQFDDQKLIDAETLSPEAQRLPQKTQKELLEARRVQREAAGYPKDVIDRPTESTRQKIAMEELRARAPKSALFAQDLDEVISAPELAQMNWDSIQSAIAVNLITNEAELAQAIESNIEGSEVEQDPEGRPLIKMPDGKTYAINKPGLSSTDFVQFFTRALAATPAARGITGASVQSLGKIAARESATEAGLQAVEAGVGGEFSPGEVALAGAVSPVAQIAQSILNPIASAVKEPLKEAIAKGKEGITALNTEVSKLSDEGAALMLADAMVREGLTPEQVIKKMEDLGPEAIPADIGNNFARLLKLSMNKIPQIEGKSRQILNARQAGREILNTRREGQGRRVADAFSDASGTPLMNVEDELIRLESFYKPAIDTLYEQARNQGFTPSSKLLDVVEKSPTLSAVAKEAEKDLLEVEAIGKPITQFEYFDAIKQNLDDKIGRAIRDGEKNKASRFLGLKKVLLNEMDEKLPIYKDAREAFAGLKSLEGAAEAGQMFFKLKPSEVRKLTDDMADSERRMFKLGAKQAIIDKINSSLMTHDKIKKLFGREGDAQKLKSVFDNFDQFAEFKKALEREANFVLTRQSLQGQSTTARQLLDETEAANAFGNARRTISDSFTNMRAAAGDPFAVADIIGRITAGMGDKKGSEVYRETIEKVGDILLETGMDSKKLIALLKRGNREEINKKLKDQITTYGQREGIGRASVISGAQVAGEEKIENAE